MLIWIVSQRLFFFLSETFMFFRALQDVCCRKTTAQNLFAKTLSIWRKEMPTIMIHYLTDFILTRSGHRLYFTSMWFITTSTIPTALSSSRNAWLKKRSDFLKRVNVSKYYILWTYSTLLVFNMTGLGSCNILM